MSEKREAGVGEPAAGMASVAGAAANAPANVPSADVSPDERDSAGENPALAPASAGAVAERALVEPVWRDALFRQKRKHGRLRAVAAPALEGPVADTHAHVHLLPDPALALAQCAVRGVRFLCDIVDVYEDDPRTIERFNAWCAEAARLVPEVAAATEEALAAMSAGGGSGAGASGEPGASGGSGATRLPEGASPAAFALPDDAARRPVPHVRFALGCHPHNAKFYDDALEARLRDGLADAQVAAIGEIGLDYHYDFSPRDAQRAAFRRQIRLAHELRLPVALHVREAHAEAFRILEEEGFPEAGCLLHCFDLDWETLEPWIERRCYVAFGGALTFKRCADTRDAAARAPRFRILTETDAPYMTPEPMRGMECTPAHVVFTAAELARVLGCEAGDERRELLDQLMLNAQVLLDRPPMPFQHAHA